MTNYSEQLIDKLPELQRTIIHLRDVEGLEISEYAPITATTENAVSVNLSRARQKLRKELMAIWEGKKYCKELFKMMFYQFTENDLQ
jgi:RNA polymerase sigma-70 factor (ECF subfamily)